MEIEAKLYDFAWNFKKQINPKKISSTIEFQEEINGWQWNLTLNIEWDIIDFDESDIIEIRNSNIWNMYTWIIESISIREFETTSYLSITFYWVFTALNDILYKSLWSRVFTKTDTIENIIKDIIDSFNSDYGSLTDTQILTTSLIRYTWTSINATDSISISFDNQNCLEAIKKVLDKTDYSFFIWKDWIIYVSQKIYQEIKYLTFEKDIVFIDRKRDKKDLVNKLYLKRNWWTEKVYEDVTSQSDFNLKEKFENDSDLQNETTQDFFWANYIDEFKNPDNIVIMKIKDRNDLIPWQLITTLNSKNNLIEKQITKIDITKTTKNIYLWEFISFGKKITQR